MAKFDAKSFNERAFGRYMDAIPNVRMNKLKESRAIVSDARLRDTFKNNTQTGSVYAIIPYFGLIGGTPQNYDGVENVKPERTDTYEQGVFTYGRMQGWTEADFSYDVTGGVDFMANVRSQIQTYWNEVNQDVLIAILDGIFKMGETGEGKVKAANAAFVKRHTYDISDSSNATAMTEAMRVGETTLNSAIQQACGDHKSRFSLVICHSVISTNLENLNLLGYLKYTDKDGVQRDLSMGTWNGKLVVIDDSMPTFEIPTAYAKTSDTALEDGKTYYTKSGSGANTKYTAVETPDVADIGNYYEVSASDTGYTSYILGEGAIGLENVGAKVPYEMVRDAKVHGGADTLISRERHAVSVAGISFTKAVQATNSPTNAELTNGLNWSLVENGSGTDRKAINDKAVPIARIISRG